MKKLFLCSLICRNGMLGGRIYVSNNSIIYKTNKITVDRKYRNLVLLFNDISEVTWDGCIFPVLVLHIRNGERYKFMIFNKRRFNKYYIDILEKYMKK